jgi:apolipoprotein N-acyltransferase
VLSLLKNKAAHQLGWRLLLAVAGGFISSLAFPRENLWPLIFLAVVMLLLSVYRLKTVQALLIGFTGGLAFYLSQIEWLSLYLGPVPWLALSILEAAIFALGMMCIALVWRFLETSVSFTSGIRNLVIAIGIAIVWTSREWVSITLPYGGFPWSRLAQTQSESFLSKWVFWGGLGWLSFLVALISAIVAVAITSRNLHNPHRFTSGIWLIGALLFAVIVPAITWINPQAEQGTIKVGAVQGNANAGLFSNSARGTILKNHLDASLLLGEKDLDLVVWPENASDLSPFANTQERAAIDNFVNNEIKVPLIFGTITERGENIYNSSILWQPGVGPTDWYDKKRPVPFAEYVPDRDFWYQLAPDLIGLVSRGYAFGERDGIFEVNGSQLGTLICFEIAVDDIGRELVSQGAQVILSQTNNADFGHSDETYQQAAFARLRAIETGRTVVNISTVGVSAVYNADGSVVQQLPTFEAGVMVQEVPLRTSLTPAMRIGSWIDLLINVLSVAFTTLAIRFQIRSRKRRAM